MWSAAPQTTLWWCPGPRFEPGPGGPRKRDTNSEYFQQTFCEFAIRYCIHGGMPSFAFYQSNAFFCQLKRSIKPCTQSQCTVFFIYFTVALCPERWERFANSNFFVMRDGIDSLPFHMTKKQRSEERQERFALGHKKGGKQWKTVKNIRKIWFF